MVRVKSDGMVAYILLAFLTTAGLFYVNLGGAFLSAFVDGMGLSRAEAGFITSANKYGAAFGGLIATFIVKRIPWRKSVYIIFPILILVDFISFYVTDPSMLLGIRTFHGIVGGLSVGIGLAVIARTKSPERGFGTLLAVQYTFGSIGIFTVPKLVEIFGHGAAFGALITFTTITLLLLPLIPDYPRKEESISLKAVTGESFKSKLLIMPLMITMAAVFLFQASNMGVADYTFELGKESGYTMGELSNLLAVANILSVSGALLVIWMEAKFGRAKPIFFGVLIAAFFTFLLHWSASIEIYFIANLVTGIMWAFCISYLLALGAAFDSHGQMAALSGFISKLGLASGPFIAALVIGNDNFASIINLATIGLVICALIALYPALRIDKADSYLKRRPADGADDHSSSAA
jgi:predicted MFS family arabinose efflux permease